MEEPVELTLKEINLEGRFSQGTGAAGAVITHPHPLYGGSMHNNVVWTAVRALTARGWSTLRFNFRGVGRSTGAYSGGLGEVEDVDAALNYLKSRVPGPVFLLGYSFGAWVAARALLDGLLAAGAVLISPPLAFMEMDFLPQVPLLRLIVAGDQDELCPLDRLTALWPTSRTSVKIRVIPGADHFYHGHEEELFQILRDHPLPEAPC
jgi:alpha/beta superfamily hydrolase|uniref:Alpha/beta fold hydrolase n=1 Tax=Desulfobacca acetoxidans TaxID=60893 RepID=A0A7C5ENV6_9BACT